MRQMFRMMNGARIAVGVQGIAVASTAYLNALGYARERQQGSSIRNFKDPNAPRVAILEHSDIRRLLLEMKAKVEGTRALAIKLALHADLARALAEGDAGAAARHEGQVDLLTPVVKAYSSDQGFRVAEMAVQIYGGAGFVEDHPAEQYLRDAKIFSIYEGTNHIQALDLVSRKLGARGGENFNDFLTEIGDFVAEHSSRPGLGAELGGLGEAAATLQRGAGALMGFFMDGKLDQVTLVASPFLESLSEVAVAHVLLEAAVVAEGRLRREEDDLAHEDVEFYRGKVLAAKYFASYVLPQTQARVSAIIAGDRSPLDMPDGGFA
jgi:hypothetical protein